MDKGSNSETLIQTAVHPKISIKSWRGKIEQNIPKQSAMITENVHTNEPSSITEYFIMRFNFRVKRQHAQY